MHDNDVFVRVYLVGYIFCIIDCHICRDIFGRIDIMYCRLSYTDREAQCNTSHNYTQSILSTWHQIRFPYSKSSAACDRVASGEIDLVPPGAATLFCRGFY
jgi:hypothetical protein